MALYKEKTVTSVQYQRAKQISIFDPIDKPPRITIREELVVDGVPGQMVGTPLVETIRPVNRTTEFNIVNQKTGKVKGTMTYGEFYEAALSFYMHLAALRDNAG